MTDEEIKLLKEKFDDHKINELELNDEQKKKIAELYMSEIDKIRSHIEDLESQIDGYKKQKKKKKMER